MWGTAGSLVKFGRLLRTHSGAAVRHEQWAVWCRGRAWPPHVPDSPLSSGRPPGRGEAAGRGHTHFQVIFLDGVYVPVEGAAPVSRYVPAPPGTELQELVWHIAERIDIALEQRGIIDA